MRRRYRMIGCLFFTALVTSACDGSAQTDVKAPQSSVVELRPLSDGEAALSPGSIEFADSEFGLLITPNLSGLSPGLYGFHVHNSAACGTHEAMGGHFDPKKSGQHEGPYASGHLGDLPNLTVDSDGKAWLPVLAPRLHVSDIAGRTVTLHEGADHYTHHAEHSHGTGGGGMYCGEIGSSSEPQSGEVASPTQSAESHTPHH